MGTPEMRMGDQAKTIQISGRIIRHAASSSEYQRRRFRFAHDQIGLKWSNWGTATAPDSAPTVCTRRLLRVTGANAEVWHKLLNPRLL